MSKRLILGSASERRQAILSELGVRFEVHIPDVEEVFHADEPRRTAEENARHKHDWCKHRFADRYIITADTIVALEGKCVAKPASMAEAANFLRMFSGRAQTVFTAIALSGPLARPDVTVVESTVVFRRLTAPAIRQYLSRVDPLDKAGGYDINQSGDLIVQSYSGSYTNIMGLPKEAVTAWLTREGLL